MYSKFHQGSISTASGTRTHTPLGHCILSTAGLPISPIAAYIFKMFCCFILYLYYTIYYFLFQQNIQKNYKILKIFMHYAQYIVSQIDLSKSLGFENFLKFVFKKFKLNVFVDFKSLNSK